MFTKIKKFIKDEGGMGVVEVILIIVVLISLVLIFKNQLLFSSGNLRMNLSNNVI